MKQYKLSLGVRILGAFSCLCFIVLGIYGLVYSDKPAVISILALLCIFLGLAGIPAFLFSRIELDEEKLKIVANFIFLKTEQVAFWKNIKRVASMFVLLEEISSISIYFDQNGEERKIEFPITSYPKEFIKEFFENIPKSTEIYLYPSLRKKVLAITPELAARLEDKTQDRTGYLE